MADATRMLPVVETVSKAFAYSASHIILMIKIAWPWIPIMLIGLIAFIMGLAAVGGLSSPGDGQSAAAPNVALMIAGGAVYAVALAVSMAAIAVEWHRALLLGEAVGWMHFRLRRRALAYIGYFLAIGLISLPVLVVLFTVISPFASFIIVEPEAPTYLGMLPMLGLVSICWTLFLSRFFLVLPGAAVGDRRISLRQSITLTKGNTLRLAAGFLLLWAIGLGTGLGLLLLAVPMAGVPAVGFIFELLTFALNVYLSFVGLSYMSFCYWFLVPAPDEGDLA